MSPTFSEEGESLITGSWTSQICYVQKQQFPSSTDNQWGILRWQEEGTDDEDSAYVRIDILDEDGNVIKEDLAGSEVIANTRFNRSINLSQYDNVITENIRIRFKLHSFTALPIVSNIELNTNKGW